MSATAVDRQLIDDELRELELKQRQLELKQHQLDLDRKRLELQKRMRGIPVTVDLTADDDEPYIKPEPEENVRIKTEVETRHDPLPSPAPTETTCTPTTTDSTTTGEQRVSPEREQISAKAADAANPYTGEPQIGTYQ